MSRSAVTVLCMLFFFITASGQALSSSTTHKVKQGDNLYTIAKKYHVSVDKLKGLNGLKSTKLKIGQQIIVNKNAVSSPGKSKRLAVTAPKEDANVAENDGEFIEYKAKKGDTFDKIATKFNIDKAEILEANDLKSEIRLSRGKTILIPKIIEEKGEDFVILSNKPLKAWNSSDERYMLVKVAKSFVGAPYKYGGESVRGLDCSAFVKKIYDIFDVQLPRSARDQFKIGQKVTKDELSVGDLVFFKTKRYIKYPTHVGIFIGDGKFIHSSSAHDKLGVKVDSLESDFYSRTYIGAVRVKRPSDESADKATHTETPSSNS